MNRKQFIDFVHAPEKLNSESLDKLRLIVRDYPYFQTARILFLLNLYLEKHIDYDSQLKLTAACVSDRSRLKDWIRLMDTSFPDLDKGTARSAGKQQQKESSVEQREEIKQILSGLEEKIRTDMEEIETKRSHLRELINKKRDLSIRFEYQPGEHPDHEHDKRKPLPMDGLLDEFIRESASERPVAAFFDPVESSRRSIMDDDDIISETLAEIYVSQGNIPKAIKIYKQLSLRFPEKSSTFAARIEKLKK